MPPILPSICICTIVEINGDLLLLTPHSMTYARLVGSKFNFKVDPVRYNYLKVGDVVYLSTTLTKSDTSGEEPVTMLVKYDKQNVLSNQLVDSPHVAINDEPSDIDPPN